MMALLALGTFASGAVYEATCVFWVHFSEKGNPLKTAVFSMLTATATVTGIGMSVTDWHYAPFFILGHGMGTALAVAAKRRWAAAK